MGSPIDIVNIDNPSTGDVDEKNTEDGTNLILTDLDALGYKEVSWACPHHTTPPFNQVGNIICNHYKIVLGVGYDNIKLCRW